MQVSSASIEQAGHRGVGVPGVIGWRSTNPNFWRGGKDALRGSPPLLLAYQSIPSARGCKDLADALRKPSQCPDWHMLVLVGRHQLLDPADFRGLELPRRRSWTGRAGIEDIAGCQEPTASHGRSSEGCPAWSGHVPGDRGRNAVVCELCWPMPPSWCPRHAKVNVTWCARPASTDFSAKARQQRSHDQVLKLPGEQGRGHPEPNMVHPLRTRVQFEQAN